jgi:quercetin dioxygenase-like cupin family protein
MRTHAFVAVLGILPALGGASAVAADAKAAVVWPAGDIKWADNPALPGAKAATLWGDPKAGAYAALKSVPGGAVLPLHTHTSDHRVVVVAGTLSLSVDGGPAKDLAVGSYAFLPGGVKHRAECKGGATCTYFEESPGAFDMQVVEEKK